MAPARWLVVRLGSLGDLVHTLPAVAALRRASPAAEIDWLVDDIHVPFLDLVTVVSSILPLRGRTAGAWLAMRRQMRARRYDIALDFQGLLKSAVLARFSGAGRVIGFDRASLREPAAAMFYNERIAVGESRHVIEKNLRLARAAGATPGDSYEFPLRDVPSPALNAVRARGLRDFALINPGAAWPNKRWRPDSFGQIAQHLYARYRLRSLVLWGPGETALADAVVAASAGTADAAPPTAIADLVALSRQARLLVSGDTGPLHIAAAVGTPVVALFGPTTSSRNGPWAPTDVSLSRYEHCACHYERRCKRPAAEWCLGAIGAGEVSTAIDTVMTRPA